MIVALVGAQRELESSAAKDAVLDSAGDPTDRASKVEVDAVSVLGFRIEAKNDVTAGARAITGK
jgi:hypothetical protein